MSERKDQVDTPSLAYESKAVLWGMIHDLLGGTFTMREAGEKWLPREDKEEVKAYEARVLRTFLFNALQNALDRLVAKPFSRALTQKGTTETRLQAVIDDVDRTGLTMHDFAKQIFKAGDTYGLTHVLVDFPKTREAGEEPATLAEEVAVGARPIFVHVKPPQLLGWRTEQREDGSTRLLQVRVHETRTEPKGDYLDETVEYVRVYTTDSWELHKKVEENWVKEDSGTHTFGEVPLYTLYFNQEGYMSAAPPFADLAHLNIAHWQSNSDQRLILSFSRMPLLFGAGFTAEEIENGLVIGPRRLVASENEKAALTFVEHTGAAIAAGERDLSSLEERMEVLGLQPFIQRSAESTATGKKIDETKTETAVQSWIRAEESFLRVLVEVAGKWLNIADVGDVSFDINNDFGISDRAADDLDKLLTMVLAGKLSHKTFLLEVKRRGVLSDTVDPDDEIQAIKEEGPRLGTIGEE